MPPLTADAVASLSAGVVLLLVGSSLIVLGALSRSGRLRPNAFAGVRTGLTRSSGRAWYAAQRASSGFMVVAGCGAVVGGLALVVVAFAVPDPDAQASAASITALCSAGWMAAWAIAGGVAGQRAAGQATED